MAEYEKYQELQMKTAELQSQWEKQMHDMQLAKDSALQELSAHFEARLKEKQQDYEKVSPLLKLEYKCID
jgi:hypothetical protein